jgi:hypothetical protein
MSGEKKSGAERSGAKQSSQCKEKDDGNNRDECREIIFRSHFGDRKSDRLSVSTV